MHNIWRKKCMLWRCMLSQCMSPAYPLSWDGNADSQPAKRLSLTNFSMAQKQIAPTTQIIRTPIKTESIATPLCSYGNSSDSSAFCLAQSLNPALPGIGVSSLMSAIEVVDSSGRLQSMTRRE